MEREGGLDRTRGCLRVMAAALARAANLGGLPKALSFGFLIRNMMLTSLT